MRSPARLVTGTAAAALTAAALGLAAPSAHAAGPGRPESIAVYAAPGAADCGPEGTAGADAAACDSGGAAPADPGAADAPEPAEDLMAEEPAPLDGLDPAGEPAAVAEPDWPETDEDEAGTGDEAATVLPSGTGTGTAPGNRPEPVTPPADPGSARPPGHRPTTSPGPSRPSGHVGTGVGGSAAPDTAQIAAGAGLVAAAAAAGALLVRRRRPGGMYR
ncbi:hypothetical protein [Streptomyces sp. NPDC057287]|uniref:hypothetical protein n=1 Tax=Streptomyces sp. NPDC057287 TaxID=3346086 RepID=UPI00363165D0